MALNKDRIFKAADKHIRSNRIEKAIAEYETWLKENPRDWNTVRVVGDLYHRIGRNDEAIKKYGHVAEHYRSDGFNVRAIATHKMILRLDPQNESAMRNLAELQAEEGLLMEAKSHYQNLVEIYNKQGHKRRAAEVFKKLAEIDPQDVKIRYKYAEFLNKQGKPDEAAREFVGIAEKFIGQGLVDEAVKILEQGRSLTTRDPALKIKLAEAHGMQGNHSQAVRMLEEVRAANPSDTNVVAKLGEAYLAAGNTDEAERAFQQLSELEPNNPENVLRLAGLRIAQSKLDAALEQLTPLVDQHVSSGEGTKASELLQKVLARDPYHIKTLLKLAEVHTILKQDSARVSAYDSLCEAYNRIEDFEKAVQVAEQLVELEPENSQHKDRLKFLKSKLGAPPGPQAPEAPSRKPPPPQVQADQDLPELTEMDSVDLGDAVSSSFESELMFDEPEAPAPPPPADLGEMVELTQEDEEHIKEKLTEAEVFVRYGLVDKAIAQLRDVLESFRYHTESREKLIEIFKDQGMNREAAQELLQLSRVYEKLGRPDEAHRARGEASELDPTVAASAASDELPVEEEFELTPTPETESDLGDVGIELDSPAASEELVHEAVEGSSTEEEIPVFTDSESTDEADAPEFELSLEESHGALEQPSEEVPFEVEVAEPAESTPVEATSEGPPVSEKDQLADAPGMAGASEVGAEEIEIDLDAPSEEIAFSVDASGERAEEGDSVEDEIEISVPAESEPPAVLEDEISVGASDDDELSVDIPEEVSEPEDVLSQSLDVGSEEAEDLEIEIPSVDDIQEKEPSPAPTPPPPASSPAPPPAPPATSGAQPSPLAAELSEVDEYITLGLYEDARDTLRELLKQHPDNRDLLGKIEELGFSVDNLQQQTLKTAGPAPTPAPAPEPPSVASEPLYPPLEEEEAEPLGIESLVGEAEPAPSVSSSSSSSEFVDLASELSNEIFGTQSAVLDEEEEEGGAEGPLTDPGLDQIFREFRKGVEKQLGTEDYDTRYNLGIAYKEMGLLDEAIAEFQLAAKDEVRGLECCSMLGLCFMEKAMPDIAIKWFSKGLTMPGRREEEYHGLRYDLAQAYETANQPEKALELYREIYKDNAGFRDVKVRVRELEAARK